MLGSFTQYDAEMDELIGAYDAQGDVDHYRVQLMLEKSNFNLEEALPDPNSHCTLLAHEKGFRLVSEYMGVSFVSALPFDLITKAELLPKHAIEKKNRFNFLYLLFLILIMVLFMHFVYALFASLLITMAIAFTSPDETVFRRIQIHFTENGRALHIIFRFNQRNPPEAIRLFHEFLPEKFTEEFTGYPNL
jgi:hypothetical protein